MRSKILEVNVSGLLEGLLQIEGLPAFVDRGEQKVLLLLPFTGA
jgi:hypothetical protein